MHPPWGLSRRAHAPGCVLLRPSRLSSLGVRVYRCLSFGHEWGTMCSSHGLLSALHMCVPEHPCSLCSLCKYRCHPVGLEPRRVCTRVSVFSVCLCVAQLWDLLILTSEAASTSLLAPPPASTWETDRQTALLPACQTVSPLTPTQGLQVCTWEVMNLPFLPTCLGSLAGLVPPPTPTPCQAGRLC